MERIIRNTDDSAEAIIESHPEWGHLIAYGLGSSSWIGYLNGIESKKQYMKVVSEYLTHHAHQRLSNPTIRDTDTVIDFFNIQYSLEQPDGTKRYKASTLQTHLSILNKYWCFAWARDLPTEVPLLQHMLKQWCHKMADPTQAEAFTAEELASYYNRIPDVHTAHIAAYAVIASHGCERGVEAKSLCFEDVTELTDASGKQIFQIKFNRAKQLGATSGKKGKSSKKMHQ
jgi:hypothetical protein